MSPETLIIPFISNSENEPVPLALMLPAKVAPPVAVLIVAFI